MKTLGSVDTGRDNDLNLLRDNDLNLLRALLASAVLVSHAYPIACGPGAVEPLSERVGAFPVQGLVVFWFGPMTPLENSAVALHLALIAAVLSWHFVERPPLGQRRRLTDWIRRLFGRARPAGAERERPVTWGRFDPGRFDPGWDRFDPGCGLDPIDSTQVVLSGERIIALGRPLGAAVERYQPLVHRLDHAMRCPRPSDRWLERAPAVDRSPPQPATDAPMRARALPQARIEPKLRSSYGGGRTRTRWCTRIHHVPAGNTASRLPPLKRSSAAS